ncbi:phospholipase A [Desulfoluna sp.]|uniref:phospholipase A n=1 Tax=Desulfoluna sp. TaxID=2045199 RepID=UPI00260CC34F|nr:phospholipase A [Desulfoluna sp.]
MRTLFFNTLLLLTVLFLSTSALAFDYTINDMAEGISRHKATWIMPATWTDEYHGDQTELVFQVSLKKQIMNTGLHVAYTQKSFWQAYNEEGSAPFRETNYNPELFYRILPGSALTRFLGNGPILSKLGADIGFEHESNGQDMPDSRSWNRAYITPFYAGGDLLLWLKLWYITDDSKEPSPDGIKGSDNPDIADTMGYSEFHLKYQFGGDQLIHLMGRGNLRKGKGAARLTWSIPITQGGAFFMVQAFHGYGDSLIDYNHEMTRVGVGIMLCR